MRPLGCQDRSDDSRSSSPLPSASMALPHPCRIRLTALLPWPCTPPARPLQPLAPCLPQSLLCAPPPIGYRDGPWRKVRLLHCCCRAHNSPDPFSPGVAQALLSPQRSATKFGIRVAVRSPVRPWQCALPGLPAQGAAPALRNSTSRFYFQLRHHTATASPPACPPRRSGVPCLGSPGRLQADLCRPPR